jgi:hypothetical protein
MILRYAPRNLDPRAAAAVAMNESGGRFGAVGDNGTSYGPWQLHVGGALPRGRTAAWANSPAGIQYALRQMASVAGGLHGQAAVAAIARRFERPANPGAEIATALSYYRSPGFARGGGGGPAGMGGGGGGGGGAPRMAPLSRPVLPPIQVQPMAPMAPAQNALQAFIAAHTPQAELSSIHSKLVK